MVGMAQTPCIKDAEGDHLVGAWMRTNLSRRRRPPVSHIPRRNCPSAANFSSWVSVREDGLHSDIAAPGLRRNNGKGGGGEGDSERKQKGR